MDSTNTTNEKQNGNVPELETKKDEPKEPAAVKKEPDAVKKETVKKAAATKKKDPQDTHGAPAATKKAKKPKSPSKPTTKKRKSSKDDKQSSSSSKGKKESSSKDSSSKRAKKGDGGSKKKPAASKKKSTTKPASSTAAIVARFKGVSYQQDYSKYEAKMFRGSREYNLGLFDLASDAALAYDAAYRITGSGTITNDVEEIKYALNWLEHPSASSSSTAMKDEGAFNFTAPSQYRSAREKELAEYKSGKVSHPGLDPKAVPSEEELKVRIKKEILNLAKAYVAQQGVPESSNESQTTNEQVGGGAGDENVAVDESAISDLKDTKFKRKKKKFGPKKSWVPEEAESASARSSQTGEETSTAEQEEEAERREQAEALLFLTKKRNTETKKAGLAVKLEKLMSGSSSRASSNPPQDDDMNVDHAKLAAAAGSPSVASAMRVGGSHTSSPSIAASAGIPSKISEGSHTASAAQDEDAKIRQLQLQHQLLQQQQALVSLRAAGGAPAGMLPHGAGAFSQLAGGGNGTAGGGMPMSNNPALEQLMALAAQRPDMVNENVLRHAIQEQQAREAMALREAQLQAALMANRGLVPGEQQQLQGQFPSFSSQLGLAHATQAQAQAAPVPGKSEEPASAEKKPQAAPSPNESSSNRPTETSMEHDESSEASVAVLLASMGHRGPIPPGLAESLQAAMNERQNENGQHNPTDNGAQEGEENSVVDPQELMRRQLANEAKKAALAQKLSSFMGGPQVPGQNELMSNAEQYAQAAQETQLSRKASEDGSLSQASQGMTPEDVASAANAETTLEQRLQALQALQGLSSDRMMSSGGGGGIDEHAMFEQLMLKKQMDEMNKQALEQKVQAYIQGRGIPQPSPAPSSMNGELSRNLALQQLLQENGVRQGLQNSDLVRQAAIQTLLANQQRGAAAAGQMGLGADQSSLAGGGLSDALTHDVVHRRIVIESMLMSEENRLRQLRESLQSQFVSHPQLGGGGAFGGGGNGGGGFNPHHALMLERERQLMAEEEARKAGIGSVMEQHAQELAIRQALALRASQGAAAGQGQDISPEALIEAARAHGVDPQTMLQLLRQG